MIFNTSGSLRIKKWALVRASLENDVRNPLKDKAKQARKGDIQRRMNRKTFHPKWQHRTWDKRSETLLLLGTRFIAGVVGESGCCWVNDRELYE
jgi:hypothetical protein